VIDEKGRSTNTPCEEERLAILDELAAEIVKGNAEAAKTFTEKALSQGVSAEEILNQGLVSGMGVIGEQFKNNEIFIPEVLVAARAMKAGMQIIRPLLAEANVKKLGKVVIGTVSGDLHDIGKNIVSMLLEGAGFEVTDLGADVPKEKFLESVRNENPDVLGMSALLTTTMVFMKDIVEALEEDNLKDKVKVVIGGAPITQSYADEIGADGYAPDAASAVDMVKGLLGS
jgi:5-methyltetrahydrofolate--homocysteine methyltransferase